MMIPGAAVALNVAPLPVSAMINNRVDVVCAAPDATSVDGLPDRPHELVEGRFVHESIVEIVSYEATIKITAGDEFDLIKGEASCAAS